MGLELKQSMRLSQHLVLTPQLQQAIKLLQLSRLELADEISREMEQNPLLEDPVDTEASELAETPAEHGAVMMDEIGASEAPPDPTRDQNQTTKEAAEGDIQRADIDWEQYLDNYQTQHTSQAAGAGGGSEDLPSLEATLTKPEDLTLHLLEQLGGKKNLTDEELTFGQLIVGSLDRDGYLVRDINGPSALQIESERALEESLQSGELADLEDLAGADAEVNRLSDDLLGSANGASGDEVDARGAQLEPVQKGKPGKIGREDALVALALPGCKPCAGTGKIQTLVDCPECGGTGASKTLSTDGKKFPCEHCRRSSAIPGQMVGQKDCPSCDAATPGHWQGVSGSLADRMLKMIQRFDPIGCGSRDLRECLEVQARAFVTKGEGKDNPDAELLPLIISKHLKNVEAKRYQAIAKDLKVSLDEVVATIKLLGRLEPKPGRLYNNEEPQYITPDVHIHKLGDGYVAQLNDDGLSKLRISQKYRNALKNGAAQGAPAKEYIQEKLRAAVWLIRSIHQRQRTIVKVCDSIIKFQREFLDKGIAYLKPLILRDVADDIGMHESTVSRVTTNKYVHTPQGIYELKFFFNSSIARVGGEDIASEAVKNQIKQIIAKEPADKPFSDQKIVEILRSQNVDIARRTVAKYREVLAILPSSKRKRYF